MAYCKEKVKSDGSRYVQVTIRHNGKRISRNLDIDPKWSKKGTEAKLKAFVSDFEKKIASGEIKHRETVKEEEADRKAAEAAMPTVKQYAEDTFLANKIQDGIEENTISSYRSNITNHIVPVIGNCKMDDVTTPMINDLQRNFHASGKSIASRKKLFNILSGIFEMAYKDGTITDNPMLKANRPKQVKGENIQSEAEKAYTAEELKHILDCVSKEPLKWQVFINIAVDTASRRGEIVALKWEDIDLKNGIVTFRYNGQVSTADGANERITKKEEAWRSKKSTVYCEIQYKTESGIVYTTSPKGGRIARKVISRDTIALLKQYQREQKALCKKRRCITPWVFTQEDDITKMMFPTTPTDYFDNFGKRYNILNFHPHILRHTAASIALREGSDLASVSGLLAHADVAITARTYSHAYDEGSIKAGQSIRNAVNAVREKEKKATKKSG